MPAPRRTIHDRVARLADYFGVAQGIFWIGGLLVAGIALAAVAGPTALIVAAALLLGMAVGLVVGARAAPSVEFDEAPASPLGYRIVRIEQVYEFDRDNPRVQRLVSRIMVRAARDGVALFFERSNWTGPIPPKRTLLSTDQRLMLFPESFEGWQSYVVAIDAPLQTGEECWIELQSEFAEGGNDRRHWVSKTIQEPVEEQVVLRILPHGHDVLSSHAKVMQPGVGNSTSARLEPVVDTATGERNVTIKDPAVGLRYYLDVEIVFRPGLPDPTVAAGHWRADLLDSN